jgi:hypothetical protein
VQFIRARLISPSSTVTSGIDYTTLTGTVTIHANAASAVIDVTPIDDAIVENDETVIISLASPTSGVGYTLGSTTTATVTIADNNTDTGGAVVPMPVNVQAAVAAATQVNLDWEDSAAPGVTYYVYRSTTANFVPAAGNRVTTAPVRLNQQIALQRGC